MNTIPSVLFDPHIGTWTMNKICNDVVIENRQIVQYTVHITDNIIKEFLVFCMAVLYCKIILLELNNKHTVHPA